MLHHTRVGATQFVLEGCIEGVDIGKLAFDGIDPLWRPLLDRIWKA